MKKIDAALYRQAYEQYRQWNEAELAERARNAGRLTPEQAWRQYVALVEFCWKMCPQQSEWQRVQKLADLDRYYAAVRKLEAWRRARGKTA
jgi:GH24 family phage-related lysozyme (muramidase)